MSHVAQINLEIKDLTALSAACRKLGLSYILNQNTYRWYGRRVAPYNPLPEGFEDADLGQCEHAIRVTDNPDAYEIGVAKRRDGKPGYTLLWDYWNGGKPAGNLGPGLVSKIGQDGNKLKQAYAAEVAERTARTLGHRILGRTTKADGSVVIRIQQ